MSLNSMDGPDPLPGSGGTTRGADNRSETPDAPPGRAVAQHAGEQRTAARVIASFLPALSLAWIWGIHGLVSVLLGLLMLAQFGAALGPIRVVLGVWLLVTAGASAWRWRRDGQRTLPLLSASALRLLAGVLLLLGGGLPLLGIMWTFGGFWIGAGLLELLAWLQGRSPAVEWPWIAGVMAFFGLVAITFPTPLVLVLTVLGGAWAILLGAIHLARGLWVGRHGGQLAATPENPSLPRRILLVGIPAVLLAAPVLGYSKALVASASENARQGSLSAFYQLPSQVAPGAPGSIVRIEPLSTPGVDGRGWRILFRSQSAHGAMTVSSGVVYAPASAGANRLVLAWAHGTVGLAANCGPSRQAADPALIPWVNGALDRGWVVTASDYVGASGVGGPDTTEQYLIGQEQGRDLLNSVRAARNIPGTGAGTRFAIYGHSQGGAVAMFGASLAATYTPELQLIAVGAISAASDVGGILHQGWRSPLLGWLLGPGLVYPWTRYYSNLHAAAILTPAALNQYQELATTTCLTDIAPVLVSPRLGAFFATDPTTNPAWRQAFLANQAPLPPHGLPIFIGHGLSDPLINPAFSAWLTTYYCAAGTLVTTHFMAGVSHGEAAIEAAPAYLAWVSAVASGQRLASDCGKPLPVAPAQPLTA